MKRNKVEIEIAAFSTEQSFYPRTECVLPLWYSCSKGVCGITKTDSAKKFTNVINVHVMALSSAAVGRFRNLQIVCLCLLPCLPSFSDSFPRQCKV